jgi:hypothetical protein
MKNPLRLFYNLLFKSDILHSKKNAFKTEDVKISIYNEDITERIWKEVGLVLDRIDDEYWKNDHVSNEYFFRKLLNTSVKLIAVSKTMMESQMVQLIKNGDLDRWLIIYNNHQATYEGLIDIRNRIINFYLEDLDNQQREPDLNLEFLPLLKESAIELRELCLKNLEKEDTFYRCITPEGKQCVIEIKTSEMSPLLPYMDIKVLNTDSASLEKYYADEQPKRDNTHVFVWNDTPKSFVQFFSPMIQQGRILVGNSSDRDPIVKALHEIFIVNATDPKTKAKNLISLTSLKTYFKKEASGDVY